MTDISLPCYLALSTQYNPVSGTGDSLVESDMAKNLESELMAHVDQMATGEQDGAAQQARNIDSDGQNMVKVSTCKGMYCIIEIGRMAGTDTAVASC